MFSNCDGRLSSRRGFAHPQVNPLCHPSVLQASPVPPAIPLITSFWEAQNSNPSLDRLNNICKVASLPSSPPRGKEPVPDGQEKASVTVEGEQGSRGVPGSKDVAEA